MALDETNDVSEMWRQYRLESQHKRGENRKSSAQALRKHGIEFETKNNEAHLIVKHNGLVADFWPGTGKWNIRGRREYRRGVFKLLDALGVKHG